MKRQNKKERRINRFVDVIITVCITTTVFLTFALVYEYHRLDTPITADVLSLPFGFFGGELLIVALRQIFGSDVTRKERKEHAYET